MRSGIFPDLMFYTCLLCVASEKIGLLLSEREIPNNADMALSCECQY